MFNSTGEVDMLAKRKGPVDPLARAIWSREAVIKRAEQRIKRLFEQAEADAKLIRKEIEKKKILLDALKRGQLKL
jgi:hypothetical protein